MLNTTTGELTIESIPRTIGPAFTRQDIESAPIQTETVIVTEPYPSYSLGEQTIFGSRFLVVLYFHGERLESINLAYRGKEFGTSWADWSEVSEMRRKAWHAAHDYAWGVILSDYDSRSAGSSIVIRYLA